MSFSVALATFLTQSCPVVPRDAVTTSMYLVKSSLAKTGALEATAPVRKDQNCYLQGLTSKLNVNTDKTVLQDTSLSCTISPP